MTARGRAITVGAALGLLLVSGCAEGTSTGRSSATTATPTVRKAATGQSTVVDPAVPLETGLPPQTALTTTTVGGRVTDPLPFQPCAASTPDGTGTVTDRDRVATRWVHRLTGPPGDAGYRHFLAVYRDSTAASTAVDVLRAALERCGDTDAWRRATPVGLHTDDELGAVELVLDHGRPLGAATVHLVARVGNAVLVLQHDGTFGRSAAARTKAVDAQERVAETIVGSLCGYADATSHLPCDPKGTAPGPRPDEEVDALLPVAEVRRQTGRAGWEPVPDPTGAVLGCTPDRLDALGALSLTHQRLLLDRGSPASPQLESAVLRFGTEEAARAAYRTVRRRNLLATCGDRVSLRHVVVATGRRHDARTWAGPASWRTVLTTAPEQCTGCDAGWYHTHAEALVGDRLVLMALATGADLQHADRGAVDDPPTGLVHRLPWLLDAAAGEAAAR